MKRQMASLVLAAATGAALAQDSLITTLSRCDASFFQRLAQERDALRGQAEVQPRAAAATFIVPNLVQEGQRQVDFKQPLRLHGLEVVGFLDELTPIPGGVDLSWGFIARASLEDTARALRPVIWDGRRLRKEAAGGGYYVRSEVWRHARPEAGWVAEATENGPPKPGTVERVFMIEPLEDRPGLVRAACSLQGDVTREIILSLRPDFPLDAK